MAYDYQILGFNMTYVWRCPVRTVQLPFFRENFSNNHLDIGVATGYFPSLALTHHLNNTASPANTATFNLTLLDLNPHSLTTAKDRILQDHATLADRITIDTIQHDALSLPVPSQLKRRFSTVSMFNLLHCIPVPCNEKVKAFQLAADCLADDGVLAGCTILPVGEAGGSGWGVPLAGMHEKWYNDVNHVFANKDDKKEVLERGLREWFHEVETKVVGCMLMYKGVGPKRSGNMKVEGDGEVEEVEEV
ncbi:hypothetical protein QBC43DRAFT_248512 [Cladorrhinum sp. PSN259]|nr:hypothetical protein QBC43DRAFT_248512 [Cladorrhinum sp. PSN259]